MVVCRFFLEGRCRYGERCFNEHVNPHSRGGRQNSRQNEYNDHSRYSSPLRAQPKEEFGRSNRYGGNYALSRSPSPDQYTWYSSDSAYSGELESSLAKYQHRPSRYDSPPSRNYQNQQFRYESPPPHSYQNQQFRFVSPPPHSYQNQQFRYESPPPHSYQNQQSRYESPPPRSYQNQQPYHDSPMSRGRQLFRLPLITYALPLAHSDLYRWSLQDSFQPSRNYQHQSSHKDSFSPSRSRNFANQKNSEKSQAFPVIKNRFQELSQPIVKEKSSPKDNFLAFQVIKEDMKTWEEGKQWPFSCYFPLRQHPAFPDFYDISPEELRLIAYDAEKSNEFPSYVKMVTEALEGLREKRNRLKNPTKEDIDVVNKISSEKLNLNQPASAHFNSGLFNNNISSFDDIKSPTTIFGKNIATINSSGSSGFSFGHLATKNDTAINNTAFNLRHLTGLSFKDASSESMHEEMTSEDSKSSSSFKFILPQGRRAKPAFSFKLPNKDSVSNVESKSESSIYTPVEKLTKEEKEAFQSSVFVIGKIPVRPPPASYCF